MKKTALILLLLFVSLQANANINSFSKSKKLLKKIYVNNKIRYIKILSF